MDMPYHLDEQKYYAVESNTMVMTGALKDYDDSAFHYVKENFGRATTGKVHLAIHKTSGYFGVMKVIPYRKRIDTEEELNMLRVARDCPFLIRLIDGLVIRAEGTGEISFYYIFLEFAPFKSLDHLTQALKGVGSAKSRFFGLELAYGLDFLHNKNIMHRDVKPENVFVRITGHVALGDLGLAMYATSGSSKMCGTYVTRPPEVWSSENYSLPVDLWMYGITLYNIISNKFPFMCASKDRQILKVKEGHLSFDNNFCELSADLISKVVHIQPSARPTIKEVIKHKYFEGLVPPLVPPFSAQELLQTYSFAEDDKQVVTELVSQLK